MKNKTEYDLKRFWDKVLFTADCWEWQGEKNRYGYGRFNIDYSYKLSHRFTYELYKGKIPDGLQLDHLCRNRDCVNPEHLEAVTCKENLNRGHNYNRDKTHCPQGHPYSVENTYFYKYPTRVRRFCKICVISRMRLKRAGN